MNRSGRPLKLFDDLFLKIGPGQERFFRVQERFNKLKITTLSTLLERYPSLSTNEKFVALCLFMKQEYRKALSLLFDEVVSGKPLLVGAASGAISAIGGDAVLPKLLSLISRHTAKRQRIPLVYALAMLRHVETKEPWIQSMIKIVENGSEPIVCRVSAAEGLANALEMYDKRLTYYRKGITALIKALNDVSADVRAAAAFALGELQEKQSLPQLKDLRRKDHARCSRHLDHEGGWTVSLEANEAIRFIRTKERRGKHT